MPVTKKMDRFRGRIGRRGGDNKEPVPKIVIDSPPEEINVPYADSTPPSTSTAPIALPEEEPIIEVVVDNPEASQKTKENEQDELSKPETADPSGENAKLLDDDDDDEEAASSEKKQRRTSLRRNSISLPNLDSLELQDLKDQQRTQRIKGVSVFFFFL